MPSSGRKPSRYLTHLVTTTRLRAISFLTVLIALPAFAASAALQLAGNAVNGGLDPQAALAAVTLNPARMFGVDHQLGSLAAGKQADVVIWDGDPFELSSYPVAVFIDGERMPERTRQTELREKYMKLLRLR